MYLLLLFLSLAVVAAPSAVPDTLVVCPGEFRPALVEWEKFRRAQGHELAVVDVPASAERLTATIRQANQAGLLKYLVIVGDEPERKAHGLALRNLPFQLIMCRVR